MRDQAGIFLLAAGAIACCAGAPLLIGLVGGTGALMLGLAVPRWRSSPSPAGSPGVASAPA